MMDTVLSTETTDVAPEAQLTDEGTAELVEITFPGHESITVERGSEAERIALKMKGIVTSAQQKAELANQVLRQDTRPNGTPEPEEVPDFSQMTAAQYQAYLKTVARQQAEELLKAKDNEFQTQRAIDQARFNFRTKHPEVDENTMPAVEALIIAAAQRNESMDHDQAYKLLKKQLGVTQPVKATAQKPTAPPVAQTAAQTAVSAGEYHSNNDSPSAKLKEKLLREGFFDT